MEKAKDFWHLKNKTKKSKMSKSNAISFCQEASQERKSEGSTGGEICSFEQQGISKREAQEMWKRAEGPAINTIRIGVLKKKELNESKEGCP